MFVRRCEDARNRNEEHRSESESNINTPMKNYWLWLSIACLAIFILQLIVPGLTDMFTLTQASFHEPWRFLTAIFFHASLPHLLYNLFALILFGLILENLIGPRKFLTLFLGAGILANLISVNFYPASLGASGAIFGIIGCLAILRPRMMVWAFSLPMPMVIASILWAAGDLLNVVMPYSNTGSLAHLAGLFVGLVVGVFLRLSRENRATRVEWKVQIPESYMNKWERSYLRKQA
jgi:membrane associated rhomboid family serine protease